MPVVAGREISLHREKASLLLKLQRRDSVRLVLSLLLQT